MLGQAHLRCHQPLRAWPVAHEHLLAGPEFGKAETPQGLHMHEDIGRALALAHGPDALIPVEPFDGHPFEGARTNHLAVGAAAEVRGVQAIRRLDLEHTQGLQAALPADRLEDDARSLDRDRETVTPEAGHMQEHIGKIVIGLDEAIALHGVKPFDHAFDVNGLDGNEARFIGAFEPRSSVVLQASPTLPSRVVLSPKEPLLEAFDLGRYSGTSLLIGLPGQTAQY